MKTIIVRHARENLKKCSLTGLEKREDLVFLTYPGTLLPMLHQTVVLTLDAPVLSEEDGVYDLLLLDATWRLAAKMERVLNLSQHPLRRSLPRHYKTAYPRRQEDCLFPCQGLASIEALFLAHKIVGRESERLLDHYHWKEAFLAQVRGR